MHEAQLHERNSFITLTYNDESLATRRPRGTYGSYTPPQSPPSRKVTGAGASAASFGATVDSEGGV